LQIADFKNIRRYPIKNIQIDREGFIKILSHRWLGIASNLQFEICNLQSC